MPPSAVGWSLDNSTEYVKRGYTYFSGCNWALFKQDIEKIGGFNPQFGPGSITMSRGQETEMQQRLLNFGVKKVYVPKAVVWHYVPKERCSQKWALRRNSQCGIENGLKSEYHGRLVLGYPLSNYFEIFKLGIIAIIRTVSISPERRFSGYYNFLYILGYIKGATHAHKVNNNL